MTGTILVVWLHHRKVLKKGGYSFLKFLHSNLQVFFESEARIKRKEPSMVIEKEMISA